LPFYHSHDSFRFEQKSNEFLSEICPTPLNERSANDSDRIIYACGSCEIRTRGTRTRSAV
jgi:hypothetical protein